MGYIIQLLDQNGILYRFDFIFRAKRKYQKNICHQIFPYSMANIFLDFPRSAHMREYLRNTASRNVTKEKTPKFL